MSPVDVLKNGWQLNPLEAETGDTADIIADIEKAIQETFIPSKGPLEMNQAGEWTYEMPWSKFTGARGFSLSPLCKYCQQLFARLDRQFATYAFEGGEWASRPNSQGISYLKFLETEICCQFCRLRWGQLSTQDRVRLAKGFRCEIHGGPESGLQHLEHVYTLLGGDIISVTVTMFPKTIDVFPNSFLASCINSTSSWALTHLWLQHCVNNHRECRSIYREQRRLPTRLINLGRGKKEVRPRFCHSSELTPDTKYVTLSHRWGMSKMLQLTLDKVETWSNSLPITELPLTFKDAMEAAKQLGVNYLWIDSLCIIQDSDDDWQREAAMMGDVYQNSYCNLTAAAPNASSTAGLFASRDPTSIQMCFVETRDLPHLSKEGYARHWFCFDRDIWERNVVCSPLFKRGWVVQEHILAPRHLHFTEHQLFWECLERRACETLPGHIPALNVSRKLSVNTLCVAPGPIARPPTGMSEQTVKSLKLWETVVERYSATSLTFPAQDKLRALSGVAQKVGIVGGYHAGIWSDGLDVHLMWHRDGKAVLRRPEEYQAPSWSWASVNGGITTGDVWPTGDSQVVVTIVDVNVEKAGYDATGRVRHGRIWLCGPLSSITVRNRYTTAPGGWLVEEWYETLDSKTIGALPDLPLTKEEEKFVALIITINDSGKGVWGCDARGLLLEPTGRRKGEYYRRGVFCSQTTKVEFEEVLKLFRNSSDLSNSSENGHGSYNAVTTCGLPLYEITLI